MTTPTTCEHLLDTTDVAATQDGGCEDCLREGTTWVQLRRCTTCGHVGCCDSSPQRHATAHYRDTQHPVIASAEPGQSWRWCYVDETTSG